MIENLVIKLNEIGYYYGEQVALQNSADLGQSISLGGFTEDGEDATAEMDFLILDACGYLMLPQPPLTCVYTERTSGKLLEKALDVIGTGVGMPQFVNGDVMVKRALYLWGHTESMGDLSLEKARRTCIGACVGSYIPYETGHPVEGQPNLGKVLELTMNNGYDPRIQKQVGPKTGNPEDFKDFEELYTAFEAQLQNCEDILRRGAWIASMLTAEFLPVTWRSLLTGGCIESGTDTWAGGANYYTIAQISVAGVDAANGLMAVKNLVFDEKKLTMAELKEALAANFEGEYEQRPEALLRSAQARQRHSRGEPSRPQGLRQHPACFRERRRGRQLHQQGHQDLTRLLHQEHPQLDGPGDRGVAHGQEGRSGAHRWEPVGDAGYRCQWTNRTCDVRGQGL